MSKPNDGGPAFPQTPPDVGRGMSLRDYFAGHALHSVYFDGQKSDVEEAAEMARLAYLLADALLKERAKG